MNMKKKVNIMLKISIIWIYGKGKKKIVDLKSVNRVKYYETYSVTYVVCQNLLAVLTTWKKKFLIMVNEHWIERLALIS